MKPKTISITGLVSGIVLVVILLLTDNVAIAQKMLDFGVNVLHLTVTPLSGEETASQKTLSVTDQSVGSDVVTKVVTLVEDGTQEPEGGLVSVTVTFDKSADLPRRSPDAMGMLLEQSGSSLKIGSYSTRLIDGTRTCQPFEGEKETEVSLSESTRFVEDVTDFSQAKPVAGPSELQVQQVLKTIQQPGTLPECASLLIWGEWQGDLLIAEVILFHDELN